MCGVAVRRRGVGCDFGGSRWIACFVACNHVVGFTVFQRGGDHHGEVAVGVGGVGAHHFAVFVQHSHDATRFGLAFDFGAGGFVVSVELVGHRVDGGCVGRPGINNHGEWLAWVAFVAGLVGLGNGEFLFALWQRLCGDAPGAIGLDQFAAHNAAVSVYLDDVAWGGAFAFNRGCDVVCAVAVSELALLGPHVVFDFKVFRRVWGLSIDGEFKAVAGWVAGRVHRVGGVGVLAVIEFIWDVECPVSIGIHNNGINGFSVFADGDGNAGLAGTLQGWRLVVGDATRGNVAFARVHIVHCAGDGDRLIGGVNGEGNFTSGAGVAGWVAGNNADFMGAFAQSVGWSHAPVAVFVDGCSAQNGVAFAHSDGVARCGAFAFKCGCGVVCGVARLDVAFDRTHIVFDFKCGGAWGGDVHDHAVGAGFGADLSDAVDLLCRQIDFAFVKL